MTLSDTTWVKSPYAFKERPRAATTSQTAETRAATSRAPPREPICTRRELGGPPSCPRSVIVTALSARPSARLQMRRGRRLGAARTPLHALMALSLGNGDTGPPPLSTTAPGALRGRWRDFHVGRRANDGLHRVANMCAEVDADHGDSRGPRMPHARAQGGRPPRG